MNKPTMMVSLTLLVLACNITQKAFELTLTPDSSKSTETSSSAPSPKTTNTSTPAPTPVPSNLVWFAPNMGSRDYPELFTKPDQWSTARSQINIFKFYTQNVLDDPCAICGDNLLHTFVEVDAFRKLAEWGIAIALEVPAVKPWGCTSGITFAVVERAIRNVEKNGGKVDFLAMDEPRVGGEESPSGVTCGYNMKQSAFETASFIKRVQAAYPGIIVGDIQAYPHFSAIETEEWLLELERQGARPSFLHMDIDIERVRVEGANVKADLQELRRITQQHDIAFGVIFTSNWHAAGSNQAYFDSTLGWIETVNAAIEKPQHVIFQSWQGDPTDREHKGIHEVPINLPENDPSSYSHTRLIREGLEVFSP